MAARPATHHVALVGLPGAGKSAAGRLAAAALGLQFVDFDAELAARTGLSVADQFATLGEPAFRAAEAALSGELAAAPPAILAPGGGWMANAAARAALGDAVRTIYLRTSPAVAADRLAEDPTVRPLVVAAAADPVAAVTALLERRQGAYAAADATIDTDARTAADVAAAIVALVRGWRRDAIRAAADGGTAIVAAA